MSTHDLGLTLAERQALPERIRNLLDSTRRWPNDHFAPVPHLVNAEEAVKHNLLANQIIKLVVECVIIQEATPPADLTLPAQVAKRWEELEDLVVTYFTMRRDTHQLELRDIRPSTLPEDPELGGK